MTAVRLDRLLANLGYGSRKEVQALVKDGAVVLDDETLSKAEAQVTVERDLQARMTVEGRPLDPVRETPWPRP